MSPHEQLAKVAREIAPLVRGAARLGEVAALHAENGAFNIALGRLIERRRYVGEDVGKKWTKSYAKLDRPRNLRWMR